MRNMKVVMVDRYIQSFLVYSFWRGKFILNIPPTTLSAMLGGPRTQIYKENSPERDITIITTVT